MKRNLFILLLLAVLLCAAPAYADSPKEIATAADFAKIAENPGGSYVLKDDIDLSGTDWTPFVFTGTLDGAGHSVRGLTVRKTGSESPLYKTYDGNGKEYDTTLAGLFSALDGATVKDLTLSGAEVAVEVTVMNTAGDPDGDNTAGAYAGLLAGYASDSTVLRCKITGTVSLKTNAKANGVGGAIGYAMASSIDSCRVNTTLILTDTDKTVRDENFLGGVYAAGYAHVTDSRVSLDAYDSCHGYVHSGGLVGMYYPAGYAYDDAPTYTFTGNTVEGAIHFFEDNPSRRAYCDALIGEIVNWHIVYERNSTKGFTRDEVFAYDVDLTPDLAPRTVNVNYTSCTEYAAGSSVTLSVPGGASIVGVYAVFWEDPGAYSVYTDPASGDTRSKIAPAVTVKPDAEGPSLQRFIDLREAGRTDTDEVTVTFESDVKVCGLYAVSSRDLGADGSLPVWVHDWEAPVEKADVMLLSTHADDEQLFFAGILPYYSVVRGYDVQVVYLTDHIYELRRHHERLNGLWEVGIHSYPVSIHLPDSWADTYDYALLTAEYLGFKKESLILDLRGIIEQFEPKVIIGHDEAGEYGHGQHMLYTALLEEALADGWAEQQTYLERVFLHLYATNPVTLSFLDTPYDALGGKTPFQKTQDGFRHHETQFWTWFRGWIYGSDGNLTKASEIATYSPLSYGQYYGSGYEAVASSGDFFAGLTSYGEERAEAERLERERIEAEKAAEEAARREAEQAEEERIRADAARKEKRTRRILLGCTAVALLAGAVAVLSGRKRGKH